MVCRGTTVVPTRRIEDVLQYLPVSTVTEYSQGTAIYEPGGLSNYIYLVVEGTVRLSRVAVGGSQVMLDIIRADEIFGESAFVDAHCRSERATAVERSKVMSWAVSGIEELVVKRPRLAVALLQILAQRNAQSAERIESFAVDNVEHRLARSLLHLSERLGTPQEDGTERMMPLTHVLLSQYVGTSREIVTHYMTRFREKGCVVYSREGIVVHRGTLNRLLDEGASLQAAAGSQAKSQ